MFNNVSNILISFNCTLIQATKAILTQWCCQLAFRWGLSQCFQTDLQVIRLSSLEQVLIFQLCFILLPKLLNFVPLIFATPFSKTRPRCPFEGGGTERTVVGCWLSKTRPNKALWRWGGGGGGWKICCRMQSISNKAKGVCLKEEGWKNCYRMLAI